MKQNKLHSVKYNFIMNFLLSASSFIFPLITFPYVSRVLLATGNGTISFYSSIANYFLLVASLGIPTYGIRACAKVRDNFRELSKTVREIFLINEIMTFLVMFFYVISFFLIPKFRQEPLLFVFNGIGIGLNMFGMTWFFQALEQYDFITIRSLMLKIISMVLMFIFVRTPNDYIIQAAITVFAASGFNLINYHRVKKYVDLSQKYSSLNLKKHIKPIMILFAQSLAVSIYTSLDTVMLGFMQTNAEVGYYNAAVKLKYILLSLVASLGQVLLPRMSYYVKNNLKNEFMNTMAKSLNFTLEIAFPLALYFVMFSFETMMFLAGDGYIEAVLPMQIITIAIIPNGLTGILGTQVLTSIEKERCVLNSVIIGAIVDFGLNLLLIPKYGASGAAFATMICEFVVLLVQIIYCYDLLNVIKSKLNLFRYIIASVLPLFLIAPFKYININIYILILMLTSILYFGIYFIILFIMKDQLIIQILEDFRQWIVLKRDKI